MISESIDQLHWRKIHNNLTTKQWLKSDSELSVQLAPILHNTSWSLFLEIQKKNVISAVATGGVEVWLWHPWK